MTPNSSVWAQISIPAPWEVLSSSTCVPVPPLPVFGRAALQDSLPWASWTSWFLFHPAMPPDSGGNEVVFGIKFLVNSSKQLQPLSLLQGISSTFLGVHAGCFICFPPAQRAFFGLLTGLPGTISRKQFHTNPQQSTAQTGWCTWWRWLAGVFIAEQSPPHSIYRRTLTWRDKSFHVPHYLPSSLRMEATWGFPSFCQSD